MDFNTNKPRTPSDLNTPVFLLNYPLSISIDNPNNIWMEENDKPLNLNKAFRQFEEFFSFLSANSIVYLLPSENMKLQDLVYVANLGIYLPHVKEPTIILSNFTSEPRVGEELIGEKFFKMMNYNTEISPYKFEGEAELKYLRDNIYIGGYGLRSDKNTYKWMEKKYGAEIIKVKMKDEYLYHLDTMCLPINKETVILATNLISKKTIKKIEKVAEVISIPDDDFSYSGVTNSIICDNMILTHSPITELKKDDERYDIELRKNDWLGKIASDFAFELCILNVSEFEKSGALLSCMAMNLNYFGRGMDFI